jgi:hypothetical protein
VKFCVIIPDRGDRPELTEFCLKQLERMTLKPDAVIHVNHLPWMCGVYDLVDRVKLGTTTAETCEDKFDLCFIIENDDFYPANYFERFAPFFEDYHFFGQEFSDYYNLRNLSHNRFLHKDRASLFTTGFKISALNNFEWPANDKPFLDIEIWKYARHKKRKFIDTGAIGMKHGLGLCGGKGHRMNMPNRDYKMEWLKARVDNESFEFYKSMANKLQLQTV